MFGLENLTGHYKAEPTEFARMRVKGKVTKEGEGISGFYLREDLMFSILVFLLFLL